MSQIIDLSHYIPIKYRERVPKLDMTEAAAESLREQTDRLGIPFDKLCHVTAISAASFLHSVYFEHSAWFRSLVYHPFKAVHFDPDDETDRPFDAILSIDWKSGRIVAESETILPEDYADRRVLEETRAEFFPPESPADESAS